MDDIQQRLMETLQYVASRLRKAGLLGDQVVQIEQLVAQVDQPCVVAVVGRVKAGKSTFINALLAADLAKVGPTETTATINHFRYGTPIADKPVRCYWRSGNVTDENRQFLDELQGNDLETLRKADGINYLEYRLHNSYLEQITLVDTPGIGAVVDEHQNRIAAYLKMDQAYAQLQDQLRTRHHKDTLRIGGEADAIIYLIGETTRLTDQAFLDEFTAVTQRQSHALNAIGIMAKIDLNDDVIARKDALAQKIALQLHENLNTVIPISSSIQQALEEICTPNPARLQQMITSLRSLSSQTLDEMLSDSSLYHDPDMEYSLSLVERKQIRGNIQWRAFVTIARIIAESTMDEVAILQKIRSLAGFERLHTILDDHFVKRGHLLRSYRIVRDAMQIIRNIRFTYLPQVDKREAEDRAKKQRFLMFLRNVQSSNPPLAHELELFIEACFLPHTDLRAIVEEIEREIGRIKYTLEDYNKDFEALQKIAAPENVQFFTSEERNELQALFGLYGLDLAQRLSSTYRNLTALGEQQGYWEKKSQWGIQPVQRAVAAQAVRRYGFLAEELIQKSEFSI